MKTTNLIVIVIVGALLTAWLVTLTVLLTPRVEIEAPVRDYDNSNRHIAGV